MFPEQSVSHASLSECSVLRTPLLLECGILAMASQVSSAVNSLQTWDFARFRRSLGAREMVRECVLFHGKVHSSLRVFDLQAGSVIYGLTSQKSGEIATAPTVL